MIKLCNNFLFVNVYKIFDKNILFYAHFMLAQIRLNGGLNSPADLDQEQKQNSPQGLEINKNSYFLLMKNQRGG